MLPTLVALISDGALRAMHGREMEITIDAKMRVSYEMCQRKGAQAPRK